MPERFGRDENGDGLIDVPNSPAYVLALDEASCRNGCPRVRSDFPVRLDATGVQLDDGTGGLLTPQSYQWAITPVGGGEPVVIDSGQAVVEAELAEGDYEAQLTVGTGDAADTITGPIRVDDILFVALGDSFAAGEGNPERPGDPPVWADDGSPTSTQQGADHATAHRSTLAGPAQTALQLEQNDPQTSVTFVFLAASGASIEEGLLAPQGDVSAIDADGFRRGLRPQLDELEELLGCFDGRCLRPIDIMTMSIGGNDAGFSFTLGSLIALDPQLVLGPIYDNLLDALLDDVADQISQLPGAFAELAARLDLFEAERVLLTAYPGSTSFADEGELMVCEEVGADLVPGLEVDSEELLAVESGMLVPLNATLAEVAAANGWSFVDSHVEEFRRHGYCGADPYATMPYAGNPFPSDLLPNEAPGVRWFRTADESAAIQGGSGGFFRPERLATNGTFHPNEYGHQAYRNALLAVLGEGA
jgi:lysophospholipase L1-like esterase